MGAASAIKYLLFFFNLLICVGAIILFSMGVYLMVQMKGSSDMTIKGAAIGFIAVGACVFLVAFLGCCGAIRESQCMLTMFGVLLSIFFVTQVICAVLIFVFKGDLKKQVHTFLESTMQEYSTVESAKHMWDELQKNSQCCGVDGPSDWIRHIGLPPSSCVCPAGNSEKCQTSASLFIYKEGCYHKASNFIVNYGIIIGAVAIGLALVELIGAIFSFRLASTFKRRFHMA